MYANGSRIDIGLKNLYRSDRISIVGFGSERRVACRQNLVMRGIAISLAGSMSMKRVFHEEIVCKFRRLKMVR